MKKKMINLRSLQETLNANELKNILGGSDGSGSTSALCFKCSNGIVGKCTGGDCIGWLSEKCPGGWIGSAND